MIRLSRMFGTESEDAGNGVLIVAEGRDQLYCIAVDQLIGKQEVVIKSLGKTYRDVPAISGGAILGGLAISLTGFHFALWTGVILLVAALTVSIWESLLPRRQQVGERSGSMPSSSKPRLR